MESFAKVLLTLTVLFSVLSMNVNGAGRTLKPNNEVVDQPQTFGSFPSPGFGGSFPGPGFGGSFPSPGFGGSFPSPGFGGSFPGPGFGGSFPSPGLGGSFPSPGFGGSFPGPNLGTGPSTFCSFPGVRCAPVASNNAVGSDGSASGSSP